MVTPPRTVLMIAFHYPPMRGSSGIQRTLKFSQYLPQMHWQPVVLSAHPRAYGNPGNDQMGEIPASVPVCRPFALDTARHLSWRGRYLGWLALPDRWASWLVGALPAGLRLVRRHRPQVLWSTYPIATAHLIGYALHRLTGLPWVADLRDPMTDEGYPEHALTRRCYLWIERKTVQHCTLAVCTTPGAVQTYRRRFPELPPERFRLIENGYDEENFADAMVDAAPPPAGSTAGRPLVLLHSGVIYPSERDPIPMLDALRALRGQGVISAATLRVVLRATGHDAYIEQLIAARDLQDMVTVAPHQPYRAALAEMLSVDGLLILQASNCNHQVPAKLYEYLRAGRPILALTDTIGDTAATLRAAGIDTIAPLDSQAGIEQGLQRFLTLLANGKAPLASDAAVAAHSRHARSVALAALLDEAAGFPAALKVGAAAA
ncbi:glycosyltransferase [Duganella sp. P38]|uniref:glycosyltransferase n=1 Tax=Duganella sp. P38 TaxID=3423949 RepID=UPI003D7BD033